MKTFQAYESSTQAGIPVCRDENHRPYVLVGDYVTLGGFMDFESVRAVGIRVYLTGGLWAMVQKQSKDGYEVVYEADLISGPDGQFVLGPSQGESEFVLVNCDVSNWNESKITLPSRPSLPCVAFNGVTTLNSGENLHTQALLIPLKAGEQVAFDWVHPEPEQDTSAFVEEGIIIPRPFFFSRTVPTNFTVRFPG